ncbi:MAG: protein translocase subunit SecF [Anaerolineaceae bacterium]|nr:protein translocase subunit SecF [Anaerolineaceae bacterium]
MNILGKRYLFFLFSFLLIIPGLVIIALDGLPLSIDFKSGSLVEIGFTLDKAPQTSDILVIYNQNNVVDAQVQTSVDNQIFLTVIKSSSLTQEQYNSIIGGLKSGYDPNLVERRFDTVGPSISKSVTSRAMMAVGIASIAVIIYITFAFRGIAHAFRYGVCAIIAMMHDILIVISIGAIGSKFFGWQMDSLYLTALLTVIGFSTQDKIVVFDRIRENEPILRKVPFEKLVNHSIIQSLQRSINTQLMTVEFLLLALALFGGDTLREMCVILLIGLLSGTYSSIFIAAPILVVWENKEWKTWFRKAKTVQV